MFWFGGAAGEFEAFVGFVDALVAPYDFLAVVQVGVKETARQVVRLAGLPQFWPGAGLDRFSLPAGLLKRAHSYLAVLAELEAKAQEAAAAGAAAGGGGAGSSAAGRAATAAATAAGGGSGVGDEGVVALLQGQTVALLLKEFGSKLGAGSAGAARAGASLAAADVGHPRTAAAAPGDEASASAGQGVAAACDDACGLEAERLQCLRALMVLVELLGGCLGSHALQVRRVVKRLKTWDNRRDQLSPPPLLCCSTNHHWCI